MSYRYPIAVVTWLDAVTIAGELGPSVAHEPQEQVSVGWLLKRDSSGVSLAAEYHGAEHGWRDESFIPAGMVKSVKVVAGRK